jgi:hypothetical protein
MSRIREYLLAAYIVVMFVPVFLYAWLWLVPMHVIRNKGVENE